MTDHYELRANLSILLEYSIDVASLILERR
jgi:hypothetical protein